MLASPIHAPASTREHLSARFNAALPELRALLGLGDNDGPSSDRMEQLSACAELALELVAERLASATEATDAARIGGVLLELHQVLLELHAHARNERLEALAGINDALARLRGLSGADAVIERAPRELCRSCAFDLALLMRLEAGQLLLEAMHSNPRQPDLEAQLLVPLDLTRGEFENDVLHDGRATVLPRGERRRSLFQDLGIAESFVICPVVSEGAVIGLLLAARRDPARTLERLDRDAVQAFAIGLGYAVERAVLLDRLHLQRDRVRDLIQATATVADELCESQVRLSRSKDREEGLAQITSTLLHTPALSSSAVLSAREAQVMEILRTGATNGEIAECLFISEETVKTHVKSILRKLEASNRVDAVSRYLDHQRSL